MNTNKNKKSTYDDDDEIHDFYSVEDDFELLPTDEDLDVLPIPSHPFRKKERYHE